MNRESFEAGIIALSTKLYEELSKMEVITKYNFDIILSYCKNELLKKKHANKTMKENKTEIVCDVCGLDIIVDVCYKDVNYCPLCRTEVFDKNE